MITTEYLPSGESVQVEWELGDQYDEAGDGHVFMHQSIGYTEDGHKFFGEGIVCDGEWSEVINAEYQGKENDKS